MSEQKNLSLAKLQKETKPEIEEIIPVHLKNDNNIKNMLEFVLWLRENKMPLKWHSCNAWNANYRGSCVCNIKLENGSWYICPTNEYYREFLKCGELEKTILKNINWCQKCVHMCNEGKGKEAIICGKLIENVCGNYTIRFRDAEPETTDIIKKVILSLNNIPKGTVNNPLYDSAAAGYVRISNSLVSEISGPLPPEYAFDEKAENLFDEKYNTKYNTNLCGDIFFRLNEPVTLKTYSFMTVKDSAKFRRFPKKWMLYGAAIRKGSWELIDTRIGVDAFPDPVVNFKEYTFKIAEPGLYQYYKLTLVENDHCQFSQMHLFA